MSPPYISPFRFFGKGERHYCIHHFFPPFFLKRCSGIRNVALFTLLECDTVYSLFDVYSPRNTSAVLHPSADLSRHAGKSTEQYEALYIYIYEYIAIYMKQYEAFEVTEPIHKHNQGNAIHTAKYFPNLVKSIRNQIVFTIFRLIWYQTDVRLILIQSQNGKYNLISVLWDQILWKNVLCVYPSQTTQHNIRTYNVFSRFDIVYCISYSNLTLEKELSS